MRVLKVRAVALAVLAGGAALTGGCGMEESEIPDSVSKAAVPTTNLIGEWKLESNGTDTKNGYNATLLGSPGFVTGKIGNAVNFNNGTAGTGGKYANLPNNTTLD